MADIAAQAGLTQQGVLHYFSSKKHLLLAVLERREDTDVERASEYQGSYLDALLELCRHNAERPGLIRLFVTLSAESIDPDNPGHLWFQHRYTNMRRLVADALRADQRAGLLAAELDAAALSVQLIALFDGLQLQWLLAPDEVDMVSALESFITLVRPQR
jgi:AcrR family transcriptional regulator